MERFRHPAATHVDNLGRPGIEHQPGCRTCEPGACGPCEHRPGDLRGRVRNLRKAKLDLVLEHALGHPLLPAK